MGDRDHLGRFAAGNKLAPAGGFNPREIRARRALKLKLAESAAAAGEVIDQTIKGDDPKAAASDGRAGAYNPLKLIG